MVVTQPQEHGEHIVEIDGVHYRRRNRFYVPVRIPIAFLDIALSKAGGITDPIAVGVHNTITVACTSSTKCYAIRGTILGVLIHTIQHFVIRIFQTENKAVGNARGLDRIEIKIQLVDEILNFLPTLMWARA